MKVLMFGWEFPPHKNGGLGVACHGLVRALTRGGTDVTFVLPKRMESLQGKWNMRFADDHFPHLTVRTIDSILSGYLTKNSYEQICEEMGEKANFYGATLFDEVQRYALRARKLAENEDFDVVHAHDWLSFPAGIVAANLKNKPLVLHVHATEYDRSGGNGANEHVYAIEKMGMDRAQAVLTVSQYTKGIVEREYGVSPEKIKVVHNGIDTEDYHEVSVDETLTRLKAEGNKIVLSLGRITLQKGIDYFVKTAERVLRYRPKTYFVISGAGDMEGQIMQEVARRGISEKVIFTGWVKDPIAIQSLYKSADLFVMPSVSEPFGITPLESLIHRTPVLISKQSGVSEILTHALKTDFWDVDEMTNKIVTLLDYPSLHEVLSEHGNKQAVLHSWQRAASKCVEVYTILTHPNQQTI